jgi:hypothetical protein
MLSALLRAAPVDDNTPRILGNGPWNNWGAIKNQSITARKKLGDIIAFLKWVYVPDKRDKKYRFNKFIACITQKRTL